LKPKVIWDLTTARSRVGKISAISLAITQCLDAYNAIVKAELAKGSSPVVAENEAKTAFRVAMPALDSPNAIQAYIACVAQGLNLEIFKGRDASQMLYAAQIALSLSKEGK
jgi:hypothetical protein